MKTKEEIYMDTWLALGTKALERAKLFAATGFYDQSLRASNLGNYCMERRRKAHLKFISKQAERTQHTAGTIFFCILLVIVIHYILTH
jgi:hypothetical protein